MLQKRFCYEKQKIISLAALALKASLSWELVVE